MKRQVVFFLFSSYVYWGFCLVGTAKDDKILFQVLTRGQCNDWSNNIGHQACYNLKMLFLIRQGIDKKTTCFLSLLFNNLGKLTAVKAAPIAH